MLLRVRMHLLWFTFFFAIAPTIFAFYHRLEICEIRLMQRRYFID